MGKKEIDVVKAACKSLLKTEGGGPAPALVAAAARQGEYLKVLKATGAADGVPSDTSKPAAQRECFNKHPMCEVWAQRGECVANQAGMVGTPATGWCRHACKACERPHPAAPAGVPEESYGFLAYVSRALQDNLVSYGCKAPACGLSTSS